MHSNGAEIEFTSYVAAAVLYRILKSAETIGWLPSAARIHSTRDFPRVSGNTSMVLSGDKVLQLFTHIEFKLRYRPCSVATRLSFETLSKRASAQLDFYYSKRRDKNQWN